jgi:hypothetical protein
MARRIQGSTGQKHTSENERTGVAIEILLKAMLTDQGFIVSDPCLSTSYDFITEWDGVVNTVQVKSSSYHNQNDFYRAATGKRGGYSVLMVHIPPERVTYVIPWTEIDRRWICIPGGGKPNRYDKYKENYSLLQTPH